MHSQIKAEMHAHTSEVSGCGKLAGADLARRCARAGYRVLVITDHLICDRNARGPLAARAEEYLRGYRAARAEGEALGLAVLLGAEVRLCTGPEDYLIYGLTEAQVPALIALTDAADDFAAYSRAVRGMGLLLVQAHPFRKNLLRAPLSLLDGVEVHNGNPRQENQNDLARAHAARDARLIQLSGSDAHQIPDIGRGGIRLPGAVQTNAALVEYLRAHPRPARIETAP